MGILISFQINKYSKTLSGASSLPENREARQSSSCTWAVSEMLCVLFMVVKKNVCAPCVVCKYVKSVLNGGGGRLVRKGCVCSLACVRIRVTLGFSARHLVSKFSLFIIAYVC